MAGLVCWLFLPLAMHGQATHEADLVQMAMDLIHASNRSARMIYRWPIRAVVAPQLHQFTSRMQK